MQEKVVSQPCLRNQAPIFEALSSWLNQGGTLLELACGKGQHGAYITSHLSQLNWQLSEHPSAVTLSKPWVEEASNPNLYPCIALDISETDWPVQSEHYDYAYCANLLHFISKQSVENVFNGIAQALKPNGFFFCYGPINENGFTSEGNQNLDQWLKQDINPQAGIKELDYLTDKASSCGLKLSKRLDMPANNVILVFENAAQRAD
jgi:cyclopropane fatty-acyl-phospholipid synthase-like methyltransferase